LVLSAQLRPLTSARSWPVQEKRLGLRAEFAATPGRATRDQWQATPPKAAAGGNEILPHASEPWAPLRGRSYSSNTRFAEKKRLIRRQI